MAESDAISVPAPAYYRHKTLDTDKLEIRVCKLSPSTDDSGDLRLHLCVKHVSLPGEEAIGLFNCGLNDRRSTRLSSVLALGQRTATLPSHFEYTALSYTWGPAAPSKVIMMEGQPMDVSENLFSFLWRLHEQKDFSTWYFIDQLCINQGDVLERNKQVQMMDLVYKNAGQVAIRLGTSTDTSTLAFHVLERYDLYSQKYRSLASYLRAMPEFLSQCSDVEIAAFGDLMRRPYWSRLWIVQEVFHAKQVLFLCGGNTFRPSNRTRFHEKHDHAFSSLLLTAVSLEEQSDGLASQLEHWWMVDRKGQDYMGLFNIYRGFSNLKCSEPRDHVFGLQGLVRPSERIPTRYDIPVATVFWMALEMTSHRVRNYQRTNTDDFELRKSFVTLRNSMDLAKEISIADIQAQLDFKRRPEYEKTRTSNPFLSRIINPIVQFDRRMGSRTSRLPSRAHQCPKDVEFSDEASPKPNMAQMPVIMLDLSGCDSHI